jgi:hypothetical protein
MNDAEMSRYITDTFKGVDVVVASGDSFFFYNPESDVAPDHKFPWATLVTSDINDHFSNLDRPSVYRLNIGVSKPTFQALFGSLKRPAGNDNDEQGETVDGYDFTAFDQLMPHPVYGKMYWVCVLNPSDETLEKKVRPILTEAYEMAVTKYNRREVRS